MNWSERAGETIECDVDARVPLRATSRRDLFSTSNDPHNIASSEHVAAVPLVPRQTISGR